jgi:hypothetical protein
MPGIERKRKMQLNVMTPKLERIVNICHAPASGSERTKAEMVRDGLFDLPLTFLWLRDLALSNHKVAAAVRTPGIRLAATEALGELSALIVEGAGRGDACLKLYETQARKFLPKKAQLPHLRIA